MGKFSGILNTARTLDEVLRPSQSPTKTEIVEPLAGLCADLIDLRGRDERLGEFNEMIAPVLRELGEKLGKLYWQRIVGDPLKSVIKFEKPGKGESQPSVSIKFDSLKNLTAEEITGSLIESFGKLSGTRIPSLQEAVLASIIEIHNGIRLFKDGAFLGREDSTRYKRAHTVTPRREPTGELVRWERWYSKGDGRYPADRPIITVTGIGASNQFDEFGASFDDNYIPAGRDVTAVSGIKIGKGVVVECSREEDGNFCVSLGRDSGLTWLLDEVREKLESPNAIVFIGTINSRDVIVKCSISGNETAKLPGGSRVQVTQDGRVYSMRDLAGEGVEVQELFSKSPPVKFDGYSIGSRDGDRKNVLVRATSQVAELFRIGETPKSEGSSPEPLLIDLTQSGVNLIAESIDFDQGIRNQIRGPFKNLRTTGEYHYRLMRRDGDENWVVEKTFCGRDWCWDPGLGPNRLAVADGINPDDIGALLTCNRGNIYGLVVRQNDNRSEEVDLVDVKSGKSIEIDRRDALNGTVQLFSYGDGSVGLLTRRDDQISFKSYGESYGASPWGVWNLRSVKGHDTVQFTNGEGLQVLNMEEGVFVKLPSDRNLELMSVSKDAGVSVFRDQSGRVLVFGRNGGAVFALPPKSKVLVVNGGLSVDHPTFGKWLVPLKAIEQEAEVKPSGNPDVGSGVSSSSGRKGSVQPGSRGKGRGMRKANRSDTP